MTERNLEEKFPKNYLTSVACEVRFNPRLKVQNYIPEFQEKIREELPSYGIESTIPVVDPSMTSQFSGANQWMFKSKDKIKTLKISINKIGFIVSKYGKFEDFYDEAIKYFNEFFELSKIDEYFRIGLRYVNVFKLNEIEDSQQISLLKFFNPVLDKAIFEGYVPFQFETAIRSENNGNVLFLKNEYNTDVSGEPIYIIDIDAFTSGNLRKEDLEPVIQELHKLEVKEFHKHITDELINVLRSE